MPAMDPSAPAPAPHRRRGPVVLMVLGGLLLVGGAVAFVFGSVMFGSKVADSASGLFNLRADVLVEVSVPGKDEVELDADEYQLVAYGSRLVHRVPSHPGGDGVGDRLEAIPFDEPDVTVFGPEGLVDIKKASSTSLSRNLEGGAVVIGELTVSDPGSYRVSAQPGGPAVTSVGIRPAPNLGETVGNAIGSGLIVIGGMVAGGLGLLVLVGGIVWLGVGGRTRPPEPLPPPPGYGPGPF